MIVEQDGQQFEFVGYNFQWKGTEEFFLSELDRKIVRKTRPEEGSYLRAIFRQVKKEYRFGQIVLRDTGENRFASLGEFYLILTGEVCAWNMDRPSIAHFPILKPIRIEEEV
jgi:hypothetical protein